MHSSFQYGPQCLVANKSSVNMTVRVRGEHNNVKASQGARNEVGKVTMS
jgi:hypothetical protein